MDRIILLIDMNAYFASVEQQVNPALRGKPIVICGDGRSVVATASYEARAYGVKTGMTLGQARKVCPGVIQVHGDFDKYTDTSLRLHRIFLEFTEFVEVFSIDECFLDITSLCARGAVPVETARAVKRRMRDETGLSCSIGIGPNKLVAKFASKLRKPDGLVEIRREDIPELYSWRSVRDLQGVGVGKKLAAKLESLGIRTAGDLGEAPLSLLTAHFGICGYFLRRLGRGEDDSPVKRYGAHCQAKSVGHSHTLPRDTRDLRILRSYLLMLSEKAGARMREAGLMGSTVDVTVRYSDFDTVMRQRNLGRHIKSGYEIYRAGCAVFTMFLPLKKAVRLVGVRISGLAEDDGQRFLLENIEKQRRLVETVDAINREYGKFTVKPASVLIAEKFGK